MFENDKSQKGTFENESEKLYYNCTECDCEIEILSLEDKDNLNSLKFECINNHIKEISINDYITQMDISKINSDICNIHEDKYISYCLDCKMHLCNKCLKLREHINHNKNNIIEISPDEVDLELIKDIINYYNKKINELENIVEGQLKKYREKLNNLINKVNNNKDREIQKLIEKEANELNTNKNKYINDIINLEKKF